MDSWVAGWIGVKVCIYFEYQEKKYKKKKRGFVLGLSRVEHSGSWVVTRAPRVKPSAEGLGGGLARIAGLGLGGIEQGQIIEVSYLGS